MMNPRKMIFFDPYPKGIDFWSQKEQTPNLFMKYFPKYLKNLTIDIAHGSVKSKVKRTKVIHDFKETGYPEKSSHWRVLLSNKMKSVKTMSNFSPSAIVFNERIKLFSGLESIKLNPRYEHDELERNLRQKVPKKMLRLRKLKTLTIESCGQREYYLDLFEELNSLPKLLKPLKLAIAIPQVYNEYLPILVEDLKINQNILASLTSFTIEELSSPEHHEAFKSLADSCPNLRHLSFEFSCRSTSFSRGRGRGRGAIKHFSETRLPAHANCLRTLKTFPNLKSLDLKIVDNEAFLRYFVLPPGVRWLALDFQEDSKVFQENCTFMNESFEPLENLETLKLVFDEDQRSKNYEDQNKLSQCILKKLPSLKKLIFVVQNTTFERMKWESHIEDGFLPLLLDSCSQSLEALEIDTSEKILHSESDFSSLQNNFSNLKTIKFKGSFSGDKYEFLSSFLQQLVSLGNSITDIDFTVIFGEEEEVFKGFFDELEKVKIPEKLKVTMKIKPTKEPYGYHCCDHPQKGQISEQIFPQKLQRLSLVLFPVFECCHMKDFLEMYR